MPTDLDLSCTCGQTRGLVRGLTAGDVNRLVCYCEDCRAFARHLRRSDVLDAHGGTDILQLPVGRVAFTAGLGHLRCVIAEVHSPAARAAASIGDDKRAQHE